MCLFLCAPQNTENSVSASTMAISAVAYLKATDENGHTHIGFVMGKSKLAPYPPHTVPRLELCGAVLAVEMADLITEELDAHIHKVTFYTDSRIVLGYISNNSRRFYVYVANRVTRIRESTSNGTIALYQHRTQPCRPRDSLSASSHIERHQLVQRPSKVSWGQTDLNASPAGNHPVAPLPSTYTRLKGLNQHYEEMTQAKLIITRNAQHDAFAVEMKCLSRGEVVPKSSPLRKLNPIVDADGLLRVGGRIPLADVPWEEKHPIILPKKHHVATLLERHYHEKVAHQGRHLTEGAVRSAGLWLVGGKRLVSSIIHKCVTCNKLRRRMEEQKMSKLPAERLDLGPPFTNVGVDVFGPWTINTRCICSWPCPPFRSDWGTNFIGACKELQIKSDDHELTAYLQDQSSTWTFNPLHSSHMSGVWERMIGIARRILDALLLKTNTAHLSHEVLVTLMSEVMAIMNARPLVPVSSNPDMPTSTQCCHPREYKLKDLYSKQWKQVQALADAFWKRWRQEYLMSLQPRRKWHVDKPNLSEGDVVLLKDAQVKRN
ncbi:hypothetical protein N1851_022207 [Merluccius polli]|uniref:DUF5641 domain-containing protein n=1 Tax=Merluccius polli TaxID=89951 RepID=A0AA47MI95_MERPO|nr:hypothetical protein N1851_022207 [Merluccius polli]